MTTVTADDRQALDSLREAVAQALEPSGASVITPQSGAMDGSSGLKETS